MTLDSVFKFITGVVKLRGAEGTIAKVTDEGAVQVELQREMYSIQRMILRELQIMNSHLALMTDAESEEYE